ncbi:hypothetical protein Acr_23g0006000 [Actinidia rufa]|uniref:Uncharacterized protein n=1 Tax=Actinidia rufa TaxID=165716 RepID=A0A7J0GN42_9ERIC|nr:hypothetical protein Acr_23g0006000 [Actinidia rufa]
MVGEKKRKRTEDGNGRMKKAEAAPPDEEVEEFFAILRRMHVAVQYFEKVNGNGKVDGRKLTGRTAIEAEALARTDGVKAGEESVSGARKNGVLDLNAVPEDDSHKCLIFKKTFVMVAYVCCGTHVAHIKRRSRSVYSSHVAFADPF